MPKKLIALLFAINIVVCFSSCGNDNATEQIQKTTTNTPQNEVAPPVEEKQKGTEISSFDFVDKYISDNFFKNDIDDKEITVSNLIVDGYEIDKDGNTKIYCLAYSPEKSLIYLSDIYRMGMYGAQSESNIDTNIDESNFQLGSKKLSWVKKGRFDGNGPRFYPDMNGFLIVLEDPKKIKGLLCYDGSKSDFNTFKSYYSAPNCKYTDVINIKGTYKIKSHVESSVEHCCPKFIFENCSFTKKEIN